MQFTDITIKVPEEAARYIDASRNGKSPLREQAMLLYPAISDLSISYGRAAEMLGMSKWQLIDLYAEMGIPYISQTWEDVQRDVATYEALVKKERTQAAHA